MTSRKRSRNETDHERRPRKRSPRRVATLYDAVAGRIGYEGFLKGRTNASSSSPTARDKSKASKQPVYPEEVLFRQRGAPARFEETDHYFAHERLGGIDDGTARLPDSDLLKAMHAYASKYYSRTSVLGGKWDWRSMDETALLALGILVEETVTSLVGETGDLAFVEGESADQGIKGPAFWDGKAFRRSVIQKGRTGPRGRRRGRPSGVVEGDAE